MTETTQNLPISPPKKSGGLGLGSMMLLVGVIAFGVVIGIALNRQYVTQPTEGSEAPDFELTTFDGETFRLSDFRGQVVVLNFWASWCAPCAVEAPDMQYIAETYRERGVVFIGVAYADNGPRSLQFLEDHGVTYYNGPDLGTRISASYGVKAVPETFIIDQTGVVQESLLRPVDAPELARLIEPLLEG